MKYKSRIGIDLGGTKTAIIAFDQHDQVLFETRQPTPKGDYRGTLGLIAQLVEVAKDVSPAPVSVGIGMPGSISPQTGLVQNANSTWLNNKPFKQDLQSVLGQPVRLANDANCLALSEGLDGAGAGHSSLFAVIIGTGCGGALITNGQLHSGTHSIAGEWGHTPLPWIQPDEFPGPQCWCGQRGCIETWVSGSGLESDHAARTGRRLTAREIVESAQNDSDCQHVLDDHTGRMARALAMIYNIFDPDIVVLGGGLSQMPHLYQQLPELMAPFIFADHFIGKIVPAQHGDASGVRGAARLWDIKAGNEPE